MKTLKDLVPTIEDSLVERFYPHVAKNIVLFWGTSYFNDYVDSLVADNRSSRQGFPFSVIKEIQKIIDYHEQRFPHYQRPKDIWI